MPQIGKRMDRRTVIKSAAAAIGALSLAGCSESEDQGTTWTLGTSGQETGTHAAGVAFSSVVDQHSDSLSMSAQTTGGTNENVRLLERNDLDIAQSTTPVAWRANTAKEPFDDPAPDLTICQTYAFMTIDPFLVKRADADLDHIETVSDIPTDGSINMSWGPRGTSVWDTVNDGFSVAGIDNAYETFDLNSMSLGDQPAAFREERLDIATCYTANQETQVGWVQELDSTSEVEVIEWGFDEDAVQSANMPFGHAELAADTWNQDIGAESFSALPITYFTGIPKSVSSEEVYELLKTLFENQTEVNESHSVLSEFSHEFSTEWLSTNDEIPVHPGAEEYYREHDLWSDDFTSAQD